MTTQSNSSKNPLILIIAVAVILFIASIVWNQLQVDNSETINVPEIKTVENKPKDKPEPVEDTINVNTKTNYQDVEERQQSYENRSLKMEMYDTPERTIKAIEYYKSINDEDKVNEFTDWLLENWPDYEYKG